MSTSKLWGGRFRKKTDAQFERFSSSFKWDSRLLPYDLRIDAAHVRALQRCRVLSAGEAKRLLSAVGRLERKAKAGALRLPDAEDVHSAVHAALRKMTGPLADKVHAARSRNDLVSQSSRLYCKEHAQKIISLVCRFQKEIVRKAEKYQRTLVPGMTHMQNAQVLSQAHVFLAYAEMLERAKARLAAAVVFCDVCVLGSGALAGVTFKLDQKQIARELGLSKICDNSYDVSGDRDFLLNLLSSIYFLGLGISRIAEDLMLGQMRGGLISVDQAFCTGSSMMPQKRNADFLELARGAAGVFAGNFVGFCQTLKGLPTAYNRDLQWDKKFIFDSVETCEELLENFARVFGTLTVREAKAKELLADESLYATDLADYLVQKGVSFHKAHEQVGGIVNFSEAERVPISRIGLDILRRFAPAVRGDVYDLFEAGHSVRMKRTIGSTHPAEVRKQIAAWKKRLKD